ncbi:hypothetical protein BURCENBC7_AP7042, partial [Burkholderia cenocepacia BC7]
MAVGRSASSLDCTGAERATGAAGVAAGGRAALA